MLCIHRLICNAVPTMSGLCRGCNWKPYSTFETASLCNKKSSHQIYYAFILSPQYPFRKNKMVCWHALSNVSKEVSKILSFMLKLTVTNLFIQVFVLIHIFILVNLFICHKLLSISLCIYYYLQDSRK